MVYETSFFDNKSNSLRDYCRCSHCTASKLKKIFMVPKYCGCIKNNKGGSDKVTKKTENYLDFISC